MARNEKGIFIKTHGEGGKTITPEYRSFCKAKERCNGITKDSHRYVARGIKFLFNSYEDFLKDIGRKPTQQHSLDRINNDGNYEVGNVRWATKSEQAMNTIRNVPRVLCAECGKNFPCRSDRLNKWCSRECRYHKS